MKCEAVQSDLVALLYDELDHQQVRTMLAHVESCESCMREWQELVAGRDLLRSLESIDSDEDDQCDVNVDRLYSRVSRETSQRNRWVQRAAAVGLAASILLIVGALLQMSVRVEQGQVTFTWGPQDETISSPDEPESVPGGATEQILQCLDRIQQLESRLDSAITQVELGQIRQGTVMASLEEELHQIRERSDLRWRTTEFVRRENIQRIAAVRHVVDDMLRNARSRNPNMPRSMVRPQRGG